MADELRHWALEDEVTESVLACDTDLPPGAVQSQRSPSSESSAPPPYDETLEADADPSIG